MEITNDLLLNAQSLSMSLTSDYAQLSNAFTGEVSAYLTLANPSNKTFTTVSANAFTVASHGYNTGVAVRFTTTGVLPTGLSLATTYYLISVDTNTLKVASSQVNAAAGTNLTISGGTGTHTIAPVTSANSCLVTFYKSNDPVGFPFTAPSAASWVALTVDGSSIGGTFTFGANGSSSFQSYSIPKCGFNWIKAVCTATSGTYLATIRINFKGL